MTQKPARRGTISKPPGRTSDALVLPVTANKKGSSGFRSLSKKERREIDQQRSEVDQYRKRRQNWESRKPVQRDERTFKAFGINKVRFPKSPIASKPSHRVDRQETPPNRNGVPNPDPTVVPLKRGSGGSQEKNNGQRPDNRYRIDNSNREKSDSRGTRSEGQSVGV
jgi:hypothetical protein